VSCRIRTGEFADAFFISFWERAAVFSALFLTIAQPAPV
jgi:hypothetical protein